jgi:hypothetical protein
MLVQIEENSATLTPFGSLIRISPVKVNRGRSWTARLRAVLAFPFSLIASGARNSASASAPFWTLD